MLLEVDDIRVKYGSVEALHGVSLYVDPGEIVTILGANGAGKSTLLRTVSGLLRPSSGEIRFEDRPLHRLPAHRIVETGIAQVPEGRRLFGTLTVRENLNLGAFAARDPSQVEKNRRWVHELFPVLKERSRQLAGTLSGGEQQMLAIARGLMGSPRLLLLDEPSLGLAPLLVKTIFQTIRHISERGVTILLVEQNARAALKLAHRGYVMEVGNLVLQDSAERLLADPKVQHAYLGREGVEG
jgi:branched-chain amino acid transport system ATP-binding protein